MMRIVPTPPPGDWVASGGGNIRIFEWRETIRARSGGKNSTTIRYYL